MGPEGCEAAGNYATTVQGGGATAAGRSRAERRLQAQAEKFAALSRSRSARMWYHGGGRETMQGVAQSIRACPDGVFRWDSDGEELEGEELEAGLEKGWALEEAVERREEEQWMNEWA